MLQVHSMTEKLAQSTDIRTALVVGGLSMQVQASTLKTSPEIVVATPVSELCHSECSLLSCMLLNLEIGTCLTSSLPVWLLFFVLRFRLLVGPAPTCLRLP